MTIEQALRGLSAYPIPKLTLHDVAEECGLMVDSEATIELRRTAEFRRAKAMIYLYLAGAPNVSQGGQSYSFSEKERNMFREMADGILDNIGDTDTAAPGNGPYGYIGEDSMIIANGEIRFKVKHSTPPDPVTGYPRPATEVWTEPVPCQYMLRGSSLMGTSPQGEATSALSYTVLIEETPLPCGSEQISLTDIRSGQDLGEFAMTSMPEYLPAVCQIRLIVRATSPISDTSWR